MFDKTRTEMTGKREPEITRPSVLAGAASAALLAAAPVPLAGTAASANAAGNGPVDPQNGFPTWFSDGTAKLQLHYRAAPAA